MPFVQFLTLEGADLESSLDVRTQKGTLETVFNFSSNVHSTFQTT